jgi:membrane-associated phospholipid phosphatase
MSRKELQVSAMTFGSRAPVVRFLATGAGLTLAAWGLGFAVTRIGASATGELSLDLFLARHRSVALSEFALTIEVLLGVSVAPIVLLTIAGLVAKLWHWVAGALVVVVTGAGWVAAAVGKLFVHRSRPPGGVLQALVSETGIDSYPSGHTAFAAGLLSSAVLITYIFGRSAIRTAVLGLPGLVVVGVSRLYLGVHYVADVLGSCLVACASTLLLIGTYNAVRRLLRSSSNPVPSSSESSEALGVRGTATVGNDEDRRGRGGVAEGSPHPASVELPSGPVATLMDMLGGHDADTGR